MINKNIVVTLFLLLIVITAGCLSDSTQSSSDVSPSDGVDTNPAVVGEDEEEGEDISTETIDDFYEKYKNRIDSFGGKQGLVSVNSLPSKILFDYSSVVVTITDIKPGGIRGYIDNLDGSNYYRTSVSVFGLTDNGKSTFDIKSSPIDLVQYEKKYFIIGSDNPQTARLKLVIPVEYTKFLVIKVSH